MDGDPANDDDQLYQTNQQDDLNTEIVQDRDLSPNSQTKH